MTQKIFNRKKYFKKDLNLDFEAKSIGFRCKQPDVRDKMRKGSIELEL